MADHCARGSLVKLKTFATEGTEKTRIKIVQEWCQYNKYSFLLIFSMFSVPSVAAFDARCFS